MNSRDDHSQMTLSIAAVERDTGIGKDTLRVWERRYGFPVPGRDANDERIYPMAQVEKLRVIKRLMDQGVWVIMFPEGTRIPRGQKGVYKTGGTRLAIEAGVPVVPIAVTSAKCWPTKAFIKKPGIVDISIGKAISSEGRQPEELMQEVEDWIESEMRRLDPEAYTDA